MLICCCHSEWISNTTDYRRFHNGLALPFIRQRIFENDALSLAPGAELADSLDRSQKQAVTMSSKTVMGATEVLITPFDSQVSSPRQRFCSDKFPTKLGSCTGADPVSKFRAYGGRFQYYLVVISHNSFTTVREMKYASQHCCDKTIDDKTSLYREQCFPNFTNSLWQNILSQVLGERSPQFPSSGSARGVKRNFWLHAICAHAHSNIIHMKYAEKTDD